jgi:prepilin-type N-terminal cleavage/methylation domain-containing protein
MIFIFTCFCVLFFSLYALGRREGDPQISRTGNLGERVSDSTSSHGYTLIELIITIGIIGVVIGTALSTGSHLTSVKNRLTAEHLEMTLNLAQSTARNTRSDRWITVAGTTPSNNFASSTLPWQSEIKINGTGKLGFTPAGTTKYAGTVTIGDSHKVSLGINVGRPNVSTISK